MSFLGKINLVFFKVEYIYFFNFQKRLSSEHIIFFFSPKNKITADIVTMEQKMRRKQVLAD